MICDYCHERKAEISINKPVSGKDENICICGQCAKKLEFAEDPNSIIRVFETVYREKKKNSESESKACPVCGWSFSKIKRLKTAGCPECYSIFKGEIIEMFHKEGISEPYTGSLPNRIKNFRSVLNDRIVLQAKLEESLRNENYEKAAVYRDYLRALEKTPVSKMETENDEGNR